MNNFSKLSLAALIALFSGCQSSSVLNHFAKNEDSAFAIQYTKKQDVVYDNELKAMFFATYLNNVNKRYDKNYDSFVVSVSDTQELNKDFFEEGYSLTLNGKKVVSKEVLNKNSELFSNISLKNSWAKYYIVNFNKDKKTKKLELKLSHPTYKEITLDFLR